MVSYSIYPPEIEGNLEGIVAEPISNSFISSGNVTVMVPEDGLENYISYSKEGIWPTSSATYKSMDDVMLFAEAYRVSQSGFVYDPSSVGPYDPDEYKINEPIKCGVAWTYCDSENQEAQCGKITDEWYVVGGGGATLAYDGAVTVTGTQKGYVTVTCLLTSADPEVSAASTLTFKFIGDSGVEEIGDESAPAEYFRLDGTRVIGDRGVLSKGIYIVRQGSSTSKIAI